MSGTASPASVTALRGDPHHLGHSRDGHGESRATGRGTGGPSPKRIVVAYGSGSSSSATS